jgi:hypothetical protein
LARLLAGLERPQESVVQAAAGRRFAVVRCAGRAGVASTLGAGPVDGDPAERAGGRSLGEVAAWLGGPDPLAASLGLAALNAACPPPDPARLWPGPAQELLLPWARGGRVVVVGDFPFTAELAAQAASLHLLELRPRPGAAPAGEWAEALERCDLLLATGTALLTGGLAALLAAAPRARRVLLGPSAPLSPALWGCGLQVLAGSRVVRPEPVLAAAAAGGTFHDLKRAGLEQVCLCAPGAEPGAAPPGKEPT